MNSNITILATTAVSKKHQITHIVNTQHTNSFFLHINLNLFVDVFIAWDVSLNKIWQSNNVIILIQLLTNFHKFFHRQTSQ